MSAEIESSIMIQNEHARKREIRPEFDREKFREENVTLPSGASNPVCSCCSAFFSSVFPTVARVRLRPIEHLIHPMKDTVREQIVCLYDPCPVDGDGCGSAVYPERLLCLRCVKIRRVRGHGSERNFVKNDMTSYELKNEAQPFNSSFLFPYR